SKPLASLAPAEYLRRIRCLALDLSSLTRAPVVNRNLVMGISMETSTWPSRRRILLPRLLRSDGKYQPRPRISRVGVSEPALGSRRMGASPISPLRRRAFLSGNFLRDSASWRARYSCCTLNFQMGETGI